MIEYLHIVKETSAYKRILNDLKSGVAAHAYLIECRDELLLRDFIRLCSAMFLCPAMGCLDCKTCKKALSGFHSDILTFPKGKSVAVSDVKEIIDECAMATVEGGARLVFIDCSGIISDDWQSKLLKILEEPPPDTYFFLSAPCQDRLLPTIVSRTRRIPLMCADESAIAALLTAGVNGNEAARIAALSMNNLTYAVRLSSGEYNEMTKLAESFFLNVRNSKQALPYIKEFEKYKERASELLDLMIVVLFNGMRGGKGEYSAEASALAIEKVNDAKGKINGYCNFMMVIDNLIMQILEVKYRCRR